METWEHLVIQVENSEKFVITPSQRDLTTELRDVYPRTLIKLLDELGSQRWQLVAVRDGEYWMKRPVPAPEPETFIPRRIR